MYILLGVISFIAAVLLAFHELLAAFLLSIAAAIVFKAEGKISMFRYSLVISIILFLKLIGNALIPIVMAALITMIFHPVVDYLHRKYRIRKAISSIIIVILLLLLFIGAFTYLFAIVINQAETVMRNMKYYYSTLPPQIKDMLSQALKDFDISNIFSIINVATSTLSIGFNAMIGIILSIYFLTDAESLLAMVSRKFDLSQMRNFYNITSKYIRTQMGIALFVGLLVFTLSSILGIRFAILIGFLAGLLNLIPNIGFIITLFLSIIIVAVSSDHVFLDLAKLALVFTIDQVMETIITPRIMGQTFKIEPSLVILGLAIGGALFGIVGFVFAVPSVVIIRNLLFPEEPLKLVHEDNSEEL